MKILKLLQREKFKAKMKNPPPPPPKSRVIIEGDIPMAPKMFQNLQTFEKIVTYKNIITVGELKEVLSEIPDHYSFGFRNQPKQDLQVQGDAVFFQPKETKINKDKVIKVDPRNHSPC